MKPRESFVAILFSASAFARRCDESHWNASYGLGRAKVACPK
jgi:hypothetical protein